MTKIITTNPSTGEKLGEFIYMPAVEVDRRIQHLANIQKQWSKIGIPQRIEALKKIRHHLHQARVPLAQQISVEMGKPFKQALAEIDKTDSLFEYYITNGLEFLTPDEISVNGVEAYRVVTGLGLIYAIMPWNFPCWQVFRALVPNLLVGNTMLLKHAENVTGSALMIEQIVQQALGAESVVFAVVLADHVMSDEIIKHPMVAGVTLTGSNRAGAEVATIAGKYLKKTVLELGGADAYIIRADVNVAEVAKHIAEVRMLNCGQVCVSPKRLIVDAKIKEVFEQALIENIQNIVIGDAMEETTQLGPMAKASLRDALHQQVQQSIQQGAKLLFGGQALADYDGNYYLPTVLTDVMPNNIAFQQELFGPVLVVTPFNTDDEALALANASPYGLGAGIFTQDLEYAQVVATHHLEAGLVGINQCVASHPALPFGGIKQSGYGRECSREGLYEFANIKTVMMPAH